MARSGASATARAGQLDPTARAGSVSGPPSSWDYFADRAFRALAQAGVWAILLLLALILWEIARKAWPGIRDYGLSFLDLHDVGHEQEPVRRPARDLGHAL